MIEEFMPLSLKPLEDPNLDDGEHQVLDAETASIFKIMGSRERAEAIVRSLNEMPALEMMMEEIERLRGLVRGAYSEGFSEGMREHSSSRGGKTWQESAAFSALKTAERTVFNACLPEDDPDRYR
jgi:hypothetical protein